MIQFLEDLFYLLVVSTTTIIANIISISITLMSSDLIKLIENEIGPLGEVLMIIILLLWFLSLGLVVYCIDLAQDFYHYHLRRRRSWYF